MTDNVDLTSFSERLRAQRKARGEALQKLRTLMLSVLRAGEISHLTAEYEGSSDSGGITGVALMPDTALNPDDVSVEIRSEWLDPGRPGTTTVRTLSQLLDWLLMAYVCLDFGGFENNEGGQGSIVWDLGADTITIEHTTFFTESCTDAREY